MLRAISGRARKLWIHGCQQRKQSGNRKTGVSSQVSLHWYVCQFGTLLCPEPDRMNQCVLRGNPVGREQEPETVSSLKKVATALNLSEYRVRQFRKLGCPALQSAPYSISDVRVWMSHSTAEGNAAESFSADSETQPVKDEDAKPNSRLSWLRTQFLGGLTAGVVLTLLLGLLGMSINTYFSIASQRHEKKQALDSVLNRLSDLITGRTDDSLSIVVRAIAQSRSSGSAETDSTVTTPDTTASSSKVVGKGRAAGDAAMHGHSTDGSSQTATTDRPDQERDLLPGLPERSATESLDVAHLYEQARSLEQEVRILQVELPYVNYILLARAAALVGRYDQAEAYLDDAEEAANVRTSSRLCSPHEATCTMNTVQTLPIEMTPPGNTLLR